MGGNAAGWEVMTTDEPAAANGHDLDDGNTVSTLPLTRRISIFALLLCAEFLYGWAWNTVDVLRPFLRQSLSLSLIQVGSAYSAQGAGALLGAIIAGQLADRFDRGKVLTGLVLGYGIVLMIGTAVQNYPELLLQRFVLGMFMGGSFPVGVSIYVNLFHASVRGRLAGILNVAFSSSIVSLGIALNFVAGRDWRLLFWLGGIPAIIVAIAIYTLVPAFPRTVRSAGAERATLPIRELFAPAVRTQTLLLATMTGLNFFGYQAFSGWLTTYLTGPRGLSAAVAGELVAWQFTGNIIGGFAWGWAADRFGRRFNALGFFIAASAIVLYLEVPTNLPLLRVIGFLYGATLCCSVIWGPWLAELYPPHLRATASSIFQWGRVISFFAPLITAAIAMSFGLTAAMLAGAASFSLAAIIWLCQRETLKRALLSPALA